MQILKRAAAYHGIGNPCINILKSKLIRHATKTQTYHIIKMSPHKYDKLYSQAQQYLHMMKIPQHNKKCPPNVPIMSPQCPPNVSYWDTPETA